MSACQPTQTSDAAKDAFGTKLQNEQILRSPLMYRPIVLNQDSFFCVPSNDGKRLFWKLYTHCPDLGQFLTGSRTGSRTFDNSLNQLILHLMKLRNDQQLKDWQQPENCTSALIDDRPPPLTASGEENSLSERKRCGMQYSHMVRMVKVAQFPIVTVKLELQDEEVSMAMKSETACNTTPSVEFTDANVRALYLWYRSHLEPPSKRRKSTSSDSGNNSNLLLCPWSPGSDS